MCKIWLESIRPLRICACVKTRFCGYIYLSVSPFLRRATGHSFGPILTVNGSNDVVLQSLVPFDGHINIAPY